MSTETLIERCECSCAILGVDVYTEDGLEGWVEFYRSYQPCLRSRIGAAWKVLRGQTGSIDCIMLTRPGVARVRDFLSRALEEQAQNGTTFYS